MSSPDDIIERLEKSYNARMAAAIASPPNQQPDWAPIPGLALAYALGFVMGVIAGLEAAAAAAAARAK